MSKLNKINSTEETPLLENASTNIHNSNFSLYSYLKRIYKSFNNPTKVNRLLNRGGPFNQAIGNLNIKRKILLSEWRTFYGGDWFHSIVDSPIYRCIFILLSSYMIIVASFAFVFYYVSYTYDCNLGIQNYREAFTFTLETVIHFVYLIDIHIY